MSDSDQAFEADREQRLRCIEIAERVTATATKHMDAAQRLRVVLDHARVLHEFVTEGKVSDDRD